MGKDLTVANMVAQRGVRRALEEVALYAQERGASVHMPRIGCGLAGGSWDKVEPLIRGSLAVRDIPVTVYDLA